MATQWKDKSTKEKVLDVLYLVFSIIAVVFAVLDIAGWLNNGHSYWLLSFSVVCFVECIKKWNTSRKIAILELICGIAMITFGILDLVF